MPERHAIPTCPGGPEQIPQPEAAKLGPPTVEHPDAQPVDQFDQAEHRRAAQERRPEELHHPRHQFRRRYLPNVPPQQLREIFTPANHSPGTFTDLATLATVNLVAPSGQGGSSARFTWSSSAGISPVVTSSAPALALKSASHACLRSRYRAGGRSSSGAKCWYSGGGFGAAHLPTM